MVTAALVRPRVLVVDDEGDLTYVLVRLLQAMGCEAKDCCDPCDCVESAKRLKPHLVLLDLIMPRLDGFRVAEQLRRLEQPRPMIVALTGFVDSGSKQKAKAVGVHSLFEKPLTREVLRRLVHEASVLASRENA